MARAFQGAVVLAGMVEAGSTAPDYDSMWKEFKNKYNKNYIGPESARFATFKQSIDYIYEVNAKNLDFTLGVNEFADLTNEEFNGLYLGYEKPANRWGELQSLGTHTYSGEELADSVDWVAAGAVTKVKNQGQCGSCWSFSTTGSIEGAWQLATKKLVSLSEQEFVDCDHVDNGCHGGLMDNGFKFAEKTALCTEESYPYKARDGTCQKDSCTVGIPQGGVTGFKDVKSDDVQAMMSAISKQPVSIAIEADKPAFQMYHGGVLSGNCGTQLDHGVLLVGYGTDDGKDYWKVKNSWGGSWGEEGYLRMLRGKGGAGECGLLKQASYPVVDGSVPPAPPGPSPGPSPPSPGPSGKSHYEEPPCQSDEQPVRVQGIPGDFCAPDCTNSDCPTDVPDGVTAKPQCILQTTSGAKSCALVCDPSDTKECGAGSCQPIQGTGICTYGSGPSPGPSPRPGGCDDDDKSLCKSLISMESQGEVCNKFALICKKSCDCCGSSPKAWCPNEVTLRTTDSSIVV